MICEIYISLRIGRAKPPCTLPPFKATFMLLVRCMCVCCVCCVCACMDEHVADVPEQRTSPYVVDALSPRSRSAPPSRRELLQHIHK